MHCPVVSRTRVQQCEKHEAGFMKWVGKEQRHFDRSEKCSFYTGLKEVAYLTSIFRAWFNYRPTVHMFTMHIKIRYSSIDSQSSLWAALTQNKEFTVTHLLRCNHRFFASPCEQKLNISHHEKKKQFKCFGNEVSGVHSF